MLWTELKEQKERKAEEEEKRKADALRLEEAERKMYEGAQEASNAWGLLAKDRELHKDEVHKLTAIIRKYDAEIRQLKTQGGGSEATLALARSATDEATAKVASLEKELAAQSVGLGKAEAAAEIAAARR